MDRELSKTYVRKKQLKFYIRITIILLFAVVISVLVLNSVKPRISLQNVLISKAHKGSLENSFTTNGVIEPYYQEMITASVSGEILKICKAPGDMVKPGDTIFITDMEVLFSLKENINHEIALKQNRIQRSSEELQRKRLQLKSDLKMDSIRIKHLKAALIKEEYIFEIGGGSQQKVDQANIEFQLASISRENQLDKFESFKKLQKLDLESMELELLLKFQEKEKILSQIEKAYVKPKINGIITSLLVEPGQHVSQGQALAHVADARRFKIEGSVSTRYVDRIYLGQEALILINDSLLRGKVAAISPSVKNGSINYTVHLNNSSHPLLRAKLQVEVRMILSVIPNTIRIANGDYYFGAGFTTIFVKNGDRLEKRNVKLGGANFDYVEVISGITEGEVVVISNSFIQRYQRYNSLKCKN